MIKKKKYENNYNIIVFHMEFLNNRIIKIKKHDDKSQSKYIIVLLIELTHINNDKIHSFFLISLIKCF